MTRTEIQSALTEVARAVTAPPVDRVAFQARVRHERRRRTAGRLAAGVGSVAAAVAVAGLVLGGSPGDAGTDGSGLVTDRSGSGATVPGARETVWFVRDGSLTALDPSGRLHDLAVATEGVVGSTAERVYALDAESRLVVRAVRYDDEGSRVASFAPEPAPVTGALASVALSGDGRYLGWLDLAGTAHRFDLKAGREDLAVRVGTDAAVTDVGADGLLVTAGGELALHTAGGRVEVPLQGDGYGAASEVELGRVLVQDRDGRSRLYDVGGGAAVLRETFDGSSLLAPYGARVSVLADEVDPSGDLLHVWDGASRPVTGLEGRPEQVRWVDEDSLLVASYDGEATVLSLCGPDLRCARLPVTGEVSLAD